MGWSLTSVGRDMGGRGSQQCLLWSSDQPGLPTLEGDPPTEPTTAHPNIQGIWHNRDASLNTCGAGPCVDPRTPWSLCGAGPGGKAGWVGVLLTPLPWGHWEFPTVHRCPGGSHLPCRWVSAGWGAGPHQASRDCWKTGEGLLWLWPGWGGSLQGFSTLFSCLAYRGWRLCLTAAEPGFVPWDVQHPLPAPSSLFAPFSSPPWDLLGCVSWDCWVLPIPAHHPLTSPTLLPVGASPRAVTQPPPHHAGEP